MRAIVFGGACWLAGLGMTASATDRIDAIAAYEGTTWQVDIVHVTSPYGKPGHDIQTLRNDCWRSGDYYACHQSINGKSGAFLVFTYDVGSRSYATYPITTGSTEIHAGKLLIDGATWTFPWQSTQDGKTTWFRVVNDFVDADHIDFRQEYSIDQVHWIGMASGHEQRTSRTL